MRCATLLLLLYLMKAFINFLYSRLFYFYFLLGGPFHSVALCLARILTICDSLFLIFYSLFSIFVRGDFSVNRWSIRIGCGTLSRRRRSSRSTSIKTGASSRRITRHVRSVLPPPPPSLGG
jgi:hypothetical protein